MKRVLEAGSAEVAPRVPPGEHLAGAVERRLVAILAADIQGYSLLMAADEEGVHPRVVRAIRRFIEALERAGGNVFTVAGDGLVAEFASSVNALRFALAIQAELETHDAELSANERISFRIGINVGDILVHGGMVGGDSVNVAARLEKLADAGGVCLSRGVYEQVHRIVDCQYAYMGEISLRNISTCVGVFKVLRPDHSRLPAAALHASDAPQAAASQDVVPVAQTAPLLSISLLGPVRATVGVVAVRLKNRKARAVLAYLALSDSGRETRERLVGLLWSESPEDKARAALRQTLHDLREALADCGYGGLATARQSLALEASTISVDIAVLLRGIEDGRCDHDLFTNPDVMDTFLQDCEDVDPAFAQWVRAKRQTLHDAVLRQIEDQLRRTDLAVAARRRLYEALLAIDPTHEDACRSVMRARAEDGDPAGALRAYDRLWRLLDEDYDSEPSKATRDLVARIKLGHFERDLAYSFATSDTPPPRATHVCAPIAASPEMLLRPTKVALIVDAFMMESVEATRSHLVEGFRRNLIACLVRFREWFVLDGGTGRGPPAIADGSVSGRYQLAAAAGQIGNIVYLALTLSEMDTHLYVWSERFELTLDGWFETQQRIVQRIAMTMNVQLSAERLARLASVPDVALHVYDKWLRGQAMISRFDPDVWSRAGQLFSEAAAEAPNFSLAFSSLAEMNNVVHIAHPGVLRDPAKAAATLDIARRAVALDPTDSRSQLCLGWSYAMAKQFPQAAVHMELASDLNPNESWTLMSTALFNAFYGEFERALDFARQSIRMSLTPTATHWAYQVSILFLAQDYEGAIDAADRAQDVIRTLPAWRAASLFHLGRTGEAGTDAARFLTGIGRRWFGKSSPSDEAIGRWLLHLYPISDARHWERLRIGVTGAGIPDAGLRHSEW